MTLRIRRVVTGHDAQGKAVVAIDETAENVVAGVTGADYAVITVFRVVKFNPGITPRMHRTLSLDYAVVIDGEMDLELDDGLTVRLKAGDVLVQRGTIHNWVNRGSAPCTIAFVLVAARPVTVAGRTLHAAG